MKNLSILLCLLAGCASTPSATAALPSCSANLKPEETCRVAVDRLRPTQMSVGMIEVRANQKRMEKLLGPEFDELLKSKPEPIVVGPDGALFIIDHHHLARTLHEMDVPETYGRIVANYSAMSPANFWRRMEAQKWVYPFDENGRGPRPYEEIPDHVRELKDDPYRSLAGIVRRRGGFGKTSEPFAEFLWADFFRTRIRFTGEEANFAEAVEEAMRLARGKEAKGLPGYSG